MNFGVSPRVSPRPYQVFCSSLSGWQADSLVVVCPTGLHDLAFPDNEHLPLPVYSQLLK
eukprot:COSAG01_NODE_25225_length_751_cov_15.205521_1_plen_58_part_10